LQSRLDSHTSQLFVSSIPRLHAVSVVTTAVDLLVTDSATMKAVANPHGARRGAGSLAYARVKKAQKYGIPIVILGKDV